LKNKKEIAVKYKKKKRFQEKGMDNVPKILVCGVIGK
jgi:hypothetical protein